MTKWIVKLAGDEFDLKTLSSLYTEPDSHVANDVGGWCYLTRKAFDTMEGFEVDAAACEWLLLANGLTSVRMTGYEAISLDGVYLVNEDGSRTRQHFGRVNFSGTGKLRCDGIVLGPDGQPIPSDEPAIAQKRLKLALRDQKVKIALTLWRRCTPSDAAQWIYLYKIYEIIGAEMAGGNKNRIKQALENRGWATRAESKNFGEAANNPDVSGDTARHGAGWPTEQGVTPLNTGEAIAFIRCLLNQWLDWKVTQTP